MITPTERDILEFIADCNVNNTPPIDAFRNLSNLGYPANDAQEARRKLFLFGMTNQMFSAPVSPAPLDSIITKLLA